MPSLESMNLSRVNQLREGRDGGGAVFYWMSRDVRSEDNWALLFAQAESLARKRPLGVVFCLAPAFLNATHRAYDFLLRGLRETAEELSRKGIAFFLVLGDPGEEIPRFLAPYRPAALFTDFCPLRIRRRWISLVEMGVSCPVFEVDAHNVVPCRLASSKQEFSAGTFRPRLKRRLDEFLDEFPRLERMPENLAWKADPLDWDSLLSMDSFDRGVPPVDWLEPGPKAARRILRGFLEEKLEGYSSKRNDPNLDGTSNLSPYIHFGQISAQRIALETRRAAGNPESTASFLEELIVRRELSDNFCLYNPDYDNPGGFHRWAKTTLQLHAGDPREYLYSYEDFDNARTHDPLWNAAQKQMVLTGRMHGYLRMYWAKKILEWTLDVGTAMSVAIRLNDRYELDGRDPSGYTGIAWSIGGVHDRAWSERPVFGKVRFMSAAGARRKFNCATLPFFSKA